ncbi:MAG: tandem-95 repeat protein [Planctomycetaceae bacterium]|nr:tandem-95 repeat protein [Planctomycetaceae bacterium]
MLSHLIRRAFGNLSSGHGFPSGALANRGWRPVARRRRRSAQRFAPSEALESRTLLTAYLVDSLGDDVTAGDNQLTLREALEAANTNVIVGDAAAGSDTEVDTIAFADGLNGTITLDGTQLTITDDVTITGLGADQLAVSGNNASRVFEIASGITAEITGLTITGGSQTFGGGLVNRGILTLNSVVVSDNTATASDGGGIRNNGTLTLTDSTVSDNTASGSGGGIHSAGTLTLTGSTVSDNMADFSGGGILNNGTLTLTGSTVSGNMAGNDTGGGIFNNTSGTAWLMQSTVSGNTAVRFAGGGIHNNGTLTVEHSTIVGNSAGTDGGGLGSTRPAATATFSHTILAGNKADRDGDEIYVDTGTVHLASHNLIGNNDGGKTSSNALFLDPDFGGTLDIHASNILATSDGDSPTALANIVGPLADNGGPTLTHALVAGSPAINAGGESDGNTSSPGDSGSGPIGPDDSGSQDETPGDHTDGESGNDLPLYDQRGVGFDRVVGGVIDIGAFELQNTPPIAVNDDFSTDEDTLLTGNVLLDNGNGADSDPNAAPLTVIPVDGPSHGSLTLNDDGSFTYTPDENYHGSDSFTYKLSDGLEESEVATVSITVNSVNDPPVAADDAFSTDEDTPLTGDVLADNGNGPDSDVDGDDLTASVVTGPSHGELSLNEDGTFTYTPDENYFGSDSFTYVINDGQADGNVATVSITVNSVNDDPVAEIDAFATNEDTPLVVNAADVVLANDVDVDGDPLTVSVKTGPTNGTLMLNDDGSFTYTPNTDFSGMDSFTYLVSDGQGGSAVATVNILVVSAEDQLAHLLEEIERLNEEGILNNGQANALATKLIGSLSKLERDQEQVAANKVEAFINQVGSLVDEGILTAEEGQSLIDLAEAALISIVN